MSWTSTGCRSPAAPTRWRRTTAASGDLLRLRGGVAARAWPPPSPSTRPSRSATPRWRCSATSCAPPSTSRPGCADARLHAGRGTERERSHVARGRARTSPGTPRPLVAPPRRHPHGRAAAVGRGADHRLRRGHRRCPQDAWEIVERCAPGVRRRLVVHRAAGVHAPGAGPLRRGHGAVLPLARRRARRRPLRARPGPRALRDRGPRGRAGLDGRLDHRRRARTSTA